MDLQPNKSDAILKPITNTRISASEWNQLVGSCMAFISAAGFSPDAADNEQFLNAFKKIASELEIVGANTALSNLASEGQGKFDAKANVSLDNLNAAGKDIGAALSFPVANSYTSFVLGASGATYTAAYNGYLVFGVSSTTGAIAYVTVGQGDMLYQQVWFANGVPALYPGGAIPITKGTFQINYGGIAGMTSLRLFYNQGNNPS